MGRLKHVTAKNRTRRITCAPANAGLTSIFCGFALLLDVVHHRYGGDQNDGGNNLLRVKAGVEKAPSDAYRSEGLHHFKIAGRGSAGEMQPLKINQKRSR